MSDARKLLVELVNDFHDYVGQTVAGQDFIDRVHAELRAVAAGAGDPQQCTGPNFHAEYNDLVATAEALAAEVEQLRGDRPPAPSATEPPLDEWAIVSPGDETYYVTDNVVTARLGPFAYGEAMKIRDALNEERQRVGAVRPPPRAAGAP